MSSTSCNEQSIVNETVNNKLLKIIRCESLDKKPLAHRITDNARVHLQRANMLTFYSLLTETVNTVIAHMAKLGGNRNTKQTFTFTQDIC